MPGTKIGHEPWVRVAVPPTPRVTPGSPHFLVALRYPAIKSQRANGQARAQQDNRGTPKELVAERAGVAGAAGAGMEPLARKQLMSLFTTTECGNQDLKRLELKGWKDGDGNLSSGANKVLVEVEEIQICWSLGEKKQTNDENKSSDYRLFSIWATALSSARGEGGTATASEMLKS